MSKNKDIQIDALAFKEKLRKLYNSRYADDEQRLAGDIEKAKAWWKNRRKEKGMAKDNNDA